MRLLIITQKVDQNDSNLGFFHVWLERLAGQVEHLYVISLEKGDFDLPPNVDVFSLGKEEQKARLVYLWRFYNFIIKYRKEYQGVFIHMNPEYAVVGGLFWRVWHKKILFWYTHKEVNWRLRLAEKLVDKIFTASKESFRLLSKKVEVVGHGIPVDMFINQPENIAVDRLCLLAVGRASPSKDFATANKAVKILNENKNLPPIKFVIESSRKYSEMQQVYRNYHILIHTSRTGSMDKVVLEALASGRIVVTSSEAYSDLVCKGLVYSFPVGNYQELAKIIEKIYQSGIIIPNEKAIKYVRENHNLDRLTAKIVGYFSNL